MPGKVIDGLWYPSVTEVIPPELRPDLSRVPADVLEQARDRGRALHRAIELYERNDLVESSLDPQIRPGFEAYVGFKEQTGFRYEAGEFQVRSKVWRYIGHPDIRGWFGPVRGLIDVKYVAAFGAAYRTYTALQTIGGYAPAWLEEHPQEPFAEFYALWLRMDGEFRVIRLEKPNAKMIFQACLVVAHEAHALNYGGANGSDNDGHDSQRAA
jgi:hypothetical protein